MSAVKPMLAHGKTPDLRTLTYPQIVQPKGDGIRAMVVDGVLLSRTAKPIKNREIQAALGRPEFNGLDGELMVGDPTDNNVMQTTTRVVMKEDRPGQPWFFYAFDKWDVEGDYTTRRTALQDVIASASPAARLVLMPQQWCTTVEEVEAAEADLVAQGYEGAILRDPSADYKHGRSGSKGPLLKIKRWTDTEAEIIGYAERMHNANEATKDAFGRTERSSAKAGKVPMGTLGNLRAVTPEGVEFEIGTGFDDAERARLWAIRDELPGQLVKYKFVPVGVKVAPRFPVYLGLRDRDDV